MFGVGPAKAAQWVSNVWAAAQTDRMSCWNGESPQLELVNGGLAVFSDIAASVEGRVVTLLFTGQWNTEHSGATLRVLLPTTDAADGSTVFTASCSLSLVLEQESGEYRENGQDHNYGKVTGPPQSGVVAAEVFAVFQPPEGFSLADETPFAFKLTMDLAAAPASETVQPIFALGNGDVVFRPNADTTSTTTISVDSGLVFAAAGSLTGWDIWAQSIGDVRMQVWRPSAAAAFDPTSTLSLVCEHVITVAVAMGGKVIFMRPCIFYE
jgi:hypothetical protein